MSVWIDNFFSLLQKIKGWVEKNNSDNIWLLLRLKEVFALLEIYWLSKEFLED